MRIAAALSWWDEPADLLYDCVSAVARLADTIVALDGAYARYPDGTPASPPEQAEAIRDAAADAGRTALVLVPGRLWAGQLEKRTYAMTVAAAAADWVVTVDADWIVEADPDETRRQLAAYGPDAACFTVEHHMAAGTVVPTAWARNLAGRSEPVPHIWRAAAAPLRVETHHWWVSGMVGSERRWLWGGDGRYPAHPSQALNSPYRVLHRALTRDELRARRNRAYCNDRESVVLARTGQEDDDPSLPRPAFDFESTLA